MAMRFRKRWTVAITMMTATAVTVIPASACPPNSHGKDKRQIERLVRDYFVARDKGWVEPAVQESVTKELAHGRVEEPASRFAARTADIAREVAQERGLAASTVRTGLAAGQRVRLHGNKATVSVSVGTALTWNVAAVGDSSFSDRYEVALAKKDGRWTITDVAYAQIPSTDPGDRKQRKQKAGPSGKADGTVTPMAARKYNREAAANYALRWSRSSVLYRGDLIVGDLYNPDYDRQDNDCTNFASQMLHAGGWPFHDGWASDNPVNWTPDLWGPRGPSRTWSVAPWLYNYAGGKERGEKQRIWPPDDPTGDNLDIWKLQPGDLIFVDWDPNGHFDGTIDHTMVVSGTYTELGFTEPTYSQHTPHRRNLPLSVGMKIATAPKPPVDPGDGMGGQGRVPRYYPVHVKDTFTTS